MTDADLIAHGADPAHLVFFSCLRAWPMGFSWSSCVAQETLLGWCNSSGLTSDLALAPDTPIPDSLDICFAVATDELMVFSDMGSQFS